MLDDMVILRPAPAAAGMQHNFAIREVTEYVADAPLTRGRSIDGLLRAHCVKEGFPIARE